MVKAAAARGDTTSPLAGDRHCLPDITGSVRVAGVRMAKVRERDSVNSRRFLFESGTSLMDFNTVGY
jgi:predicted xylose isomerase-like sugar epimerase